MHTPPIDPRDRDQLAAQTSALAQRYTTDTGVEPGRGWRPREDGGADAGQALIAIFARFAETVVDRINRAPERNYLAFLNLIGIEPLPPRPARVPLTFTLAEGSPAAAVVPTGTRVGAPALEGEDDDLVFETEAALVVSRAQLQSVVVGDAETDTYSDRTGAALGLLDEPFAAFVGDRPVPHQLFLACDPLLTAPGTKSVTITIGSPDTAQWTSWPFTWSRWDGQAWQPLPCTGEVRDGAWRLTFPALPQLIPQAVDGVEAGWLRLSLEMGLPRGESGLEPESVAVGGRDPVDPRLPLAPFGETSQVKWFYLSADEALAAGGAAARLQVALDRPGAANIGNPVTLIWSYKAGPDWRELGRSGSVAVPAAAGEFGLRDGTAAFTRGGEISFRVPASWPRTVHRSRIGRWLRVEIADAGGSYTTLPRIGSLTAGYGWDLPRVSGITAQVNTTPAPLPPPAAASNATPLDLSKDFYPFGEQPRFNDTFTIACPDELARPGAEVALTLTVNPARPARTEGTRRLSWEVPDGQSWRALATTAALGGTMRFTWPPGFAPAVVNGDERHWLRVRLVEGDYGGPASYEQVPATAKPEDAVTYRFKAATWAPPILQSASWTAAAAAAPTPASAIVSANDFTYRRHAHGQQFTPFSTGDEPDPALYLGFDRPFDGRPATLYLQVEPPAPEEVAADQLAEIDPTTRPQVVWEYSGPDGWRALDAVDETDTLASRGLVRFVGPADLTARDRFGQRRCWLRARWRRGYFPFPPRLRRVLLNTTWAAQVTMVDGEILGASTGNPGQEFRTAQAPVQPEQQLVVREADDVDQPDEAWVALDGGARLPPVRGDGPALHDRPVGRGDPLRRRRGRPHPAAGTEQRPYHLPHRWRRGREPGRRNDLPAKVRDPADRQRHQPRARAGWRGGRSPRPAQRARAAGAAPPGSGDHR